MAAAAASMNRLHLEKSPYLLQHKNNPVDWYPWSQEAIQKAKDERKLIFLSVGYSTCHWCHVMEKESFENESVAKILNENFVSIKVDREERPDVDKLYMTFILLISGHGGWPMSVFLTPELTPVTGGTYFPPEDRWGMPGFKTVLVKVAEKWRENPEELLTTGHSIINAIKKHLETKPSSGHIGNDLSDPRTIEQKFNQAVKIYRNNYDLEWGGSEGAPKFPEVAKLNFMLHAHQYRQDASAKVIDVLLVTLDRMAAGGIHDHVFGGFSRYSVDAKWHVPHFEKMLYDQGQLLTIYSNAFKVTRRPLYLETAERIYLYLVNDLLNEEGGFYSGEDADSYPETGSKDKIEGAFYAWTQNEIRLAIDESKAKFPQLDGVDPFKVYIYHYSVRETGNVEPSSDPHGHLTAKNILIVHGNVEETADKFGIEVAQVKEILRIANAALHEVRNTRPRPHLDTKIICGWNGLVLSGLSALATIKDAKNRSEHLKTAKNLVNFIRTRLYDRESGKLLRSCYAESKDGKVLMPEGDARFAFLDDYAFIIRGLLDYYIASLDMDVLHFARMLQNRQNELFWDDINGGYFYTEVEAPGILVRLKEDHDGAEPSGNSVTASNLIFLQAYFEDAGYEEKINRLFEFFISHSPFGYTLPEMMRALLLHDGGLFMFVLVGDDSEQANALLDACRNYYAPALVIMHSKPGGTEVTSTAFGMSLSEFKQVNGLPTAYICKEKVCALPITDVNRLVEDMDKKYLYKVEV